MRLSGQPFLQVGFRPFFLGAVVFAVLTMSLWLTFYVFGLTLDLSVLAPSEWHAHEMVYGYTVAVIAGFLLTAVRNWTNLETPSGWPLGGLWLLWVGARFCFAAGDRLAPLAAVLDLAFIAALTYSVMYPIIRARQWRQLGIMALLALLAAGNLLFYLGQAGLFDDGVRRGIYLGFYLVIGLVMVMSRRLIPFFAERGVGYPVVLRQSRVLDIASIVLFLPFVVLEIFTDARPVASLFAASLAGVHVLRLSGWYTAGIWRTPLLWGLYVAYGSIAAGFAGYVGGALGWVPPLTAVHLFAVGGVGLMTMSMMARVSLGHSGRSVHAPPRMVGIALSLLLATLVTRALLPMVWDAYAFTLIVISQSLWIAAFLVLGAVLVPMLVTARVDAGGG